MKDGLINEYLQLGFTRAEARVIANVAAEYYSRHGHLAELVRQEIKNGFVPPEVGK